MKEFLDIWDDKCNEIFKKLKKAIIIKPVMIHFNQTKKTFLECDFNNLISGGILFQLNNKD